jgi:hypothetical protein
MFDLTVVNQRGIENPHRNTRLYDCDGMFGVLLLHLKSG